MLGPVVAQFGPLHQARGCCHVVAPDPTSSDESQQTPQHGASCSPRAHEQCAEGAAALGLQCTAWSTPHAGVDQLAGCEDPRLAKAAIRQGLARMNSSQLAELQQTLRQQRISRQQEMPLPVPAAADYGWPGSHEAARTQLCSYRLGAGLPSTQQVLASANQVLASALAGSSLATAPGLTTAAHLMSRLEQQQWCPEQQLATWQQPAQLVSAAAAAAAALGSSSRQLEKVGSSDMAAAAAAPHNSNQQQHPGVAGSKGRRGRRTRCSPARLAATASAALGPPANTAPPTAAGQPQQQAAPGPAAAMSHAPAASLVRAAAAAAAAAAGPAAAAAGGWCGPAAAVQRGGLLSALVAAALAAEQQQQVAACSAPHVPTGDTGAAAGSAPARRSRRDRQAMEWGGDAFAAAAATPGSSASHGTPPPPAALPAMAAWQPECSSRAGSAESCPCPAQQEQQPAVKRVRFAVAEEPTGDQAAGQHQLPGGRPKRQRRGSLLLQQQEEQEQEAEEEEELPAKPRIVRRIGVRAQARKRMFKKTTRRRRPQRAPGA